MRAIDRYEDAITAVLFWCEQGESYKSSVRTEAEKQGLTPERLDHLVRVWCAVAGETVPV